MTSKRLALDVMGGDEAPLATLRGAIAATSPSGGGLAPQRILLVGEEARIRAGLAELETTVEFPIRHASQVIEMGDAPAVALRRKPDSSINGCVRAIAEGEAAAMVSMGNTGACVGAATLGLGTLPGVRRPGIAVTFEFKGKKVTVIDMGANIAPKPQHLFQYGVMGSIYVRDCLGIESPRVGLLNVGTEPSKGTDVLRETFALLQGAPVRFLGNVEGDDLFQGGVDVVVTDGFTGNVILKLLENFAGFLMGLVMSELRAHDPDWGGEALAHIRRNIDYAEYGGALLLGVSGSVVIGHGRSDGPAVANALRLAARVVDAGVERHIIDGFAELVG